MLTNMKSPETYFQAAFRVQSPWTAVDDAGRTQVIKRECYVFDFALDRALRMVSDYSCRLKVDEGVGPEQKVGEFINFLPVLAYDGSTMHQVSASEILDIAMAGTSATLLARRWESALLVNVDNDTLRRILDNEDAMRAIMSIEGFRALGGDIIETIVNKSEAVKKAKREAADKGEELTPKQKKELTEEEKDYKSKRKQVQEKLIKFATRIPVFMYLTDFREETLKDVITKLEPGLFKKVTGLTVADFELLVSLGVFNDALMNDAVYKFRRYENASLTYTGVDRHAGERMGLFDTSLSNTDYLTMAQEESMIAPNGLMRRAGSDTGSGSRASASRTRDGRTRADGGIIRDASQGARGGAGRSAASSTNEGAGRGVTGSATRSAVGGAAKKAIAGDSRGDTGSVAPSRGAVPSGAVTDEGAASGTARPAVDEAALEELCRGDRVFHRAFGYGSVVSLDDAHITVHFSSDDRKKNRMFGFPSAFYQGLLQLD